jgi:transcriptional regulator with XRE-family HTH domain
MPNISTKSSQLGSTVAKIPSFLIMGQFEKSQEGLFSVITYQETATFCGGGWRMWGSRKARDSEVRGFRGNSLMVRGGVGMKEKRAIDIQVGQQIKKARETAGYTQDKFAEMIGMGTKNVSAIERGMVGVSLSTIKRICKIFRISSGTLIMDESSNPDVEKLNFLMERLKRLSTQQFEIVFDIIRKLFEIFALQEKGNE